MLTDPVANQSAVDEIQVQIKTPYIVNFTKVSWHHCNSSGLNSRKEIHPYIVTVTKGTVLVKVARCVVTDGHCTDGGHCDGSKKYTPGPIFKFKCLIIAAPHLFKFKFMITEFCNSNPCLHTYKATNLLSPWYSKDQPGCPATNTTLPFQECLKCHRNGTIRRWIPNNKHFPTREPGLMERSLYH